MLTLVQMNGIGALLGFRTAGAHSLLPFLILGVGFDDIYVMVNGIDNSREEIEDLEEQMI